MTMMMKMKRVSGFTYKFVRINPSDIDMLNLNYLIDKYTAYCGYTFEPTTSGRNYLKGFIVFPIRVEVDYLRWRLPNFLVDFVRQFDKIESRLKTLATTVWKNEHPLKSIQTNLIKDFNDAERKV